MSGVSFVEGVRSLLVPIDLVHQHPDNPNNGDIEELVQSIQVNGFYTAVTVDKNTKEILVGNHRYQALLALGAKQIPVIWADKSEEGRYRILVGDNILARLARMEPAQTAAILRDLKDTTDLGLAGTGVSDMAYEKMLIDLAKETEPIPANGGFGTHQATIFQVVVEFDNREERDEAYASLMDHYEGDDHRVRTVDI